MGFVRNCPNGCSYDTGTKTIGNIKVSVFICDEDEIITCPVCNRILYKPKTKMTEEIIDNILRG